MYLNYPQLIKIMNKTVRTILQVISYIITLLLGGAAGGAIAQ